MKGVCYVALGQNARREMKASRATLKDLPSTVFDTWDQVSGVTIVQQAHLAKTRVFEWSPYDYTLLLDADTRVMGDLSFGFLLLEAGWDIVMVPSLPPRENLVLWHLSPKEKEHTINSLGNWGHIMLNTGVLFFRKSEAVQRLFTAWEHEWNLFKGPDQGAFLRALRQHPVKIFLLSQAYNSAKGSIVKHLFGRAV